MSNKTNNKTDNKLNNKLNKKAKEYEIVILGAFPEEIKENNFYSICFEEELNSLKTFSLFQNLIIRIDKNKAYLNLIINDPKIDNYQILLSSIILNLSLVKDLEIFDIIDSSVSNNLINNKNNRKNSKENKFNVLERSKIISLIANDKINNTLNYFNQEIDNLKIYLGSSLNDYLANYKKHRNKIQIEIKYMLSRIENKISKLISKGSIKHLIATSSISLGLLLMPNISYAMDSNKINNYVDNSLSGWVNYYDNGTFKDPLNSRTDGYGRGMLGYAYIKRGIETNNQAWIDIGLSALNSQALTNTKLPFDLLTIAKTYNYNQTHLSNDPRWLAVKPNIESYLTNFNDYTNDHSSGLPYCYVNGSCYNNWKLIQALGLVHLAQTNLNSSNPNSYLANNQYKLLEKLNDNLQLVNKFKSPTVSIDNNNARLLSDPITNPLAYHAFSGYLLSSLINQPNHSIIDARDNQLREQLYTLNNEINHYSFNFANPYGELAYMGRSYRQTFSLSSLIYSNVVQETDNDQKFNQTKTQFETLLNYGKTDNLINTTPSMKDRTYKGIDEYTSLAAYNGLTIMQILDTRDALTPELESKINNPNNKFNNSSDNNSRTKLYCDKKGSQVCVFKNNDFFLAFKTKTQTKEMRYDIGILQLYTKHGNSYRKLHDNRFNSTQDNSFPIINGFKASSFDSIKQLNNYSLKLKVNYTKDNKTFSRDAYLTFKNKKFYLTIKSKDKDNIIYNAYLSNNQLTNKHSYIDSKRKITFSKQANDFKKIKTFANTETVNAQHYQYTFNNINSLTVEFKSL